MIRSPWLVLILFLIVQIFVSFVGRSISPLAPFIALDYELSNSQIGLLPSALFLGNALTSVHSGWLTDRIGTKKMLFLVTLLLGISFMLLSIIPSFYIIIICVLLGGVAYGAFQPVSNRVIIYSFDKKKAGTAMGIKQMGVTAGSALSALILIPLSNYFNWNSALFYSAFLLILVGSLVSLIYQPSKTEQNKDNNSKLNIKESITMLLKNKPLLYSSIAIAGLTSVQLTMTTYIIIYSSSILLFSLVLSGLFLALSEVGGSLGRIIWGIISDRFFNGNRLIILIIVAVFTAICSLILIWIPPKVSLWFFIPFVILLGFNISGFNGIWMSLAAESVEKKYSGIASGFSLGIGSLGVVLGPPIFGKIVDITGDFLFGWLFILLQMLIVIVTILLLRNSNGGVLWRSNFNER